MIDLNAFLQDIVDKLNAVEGLQALVLGGSWASNTQTSRLCNQIRPHPWRYRM